MRLNVRPLAIVLAILGAPRGAGAASSPLPLDLLPSACVGWGSQLMRAAYTGNFMTLWDGAGDTQAVGFLPGGSGDYATADQFVATYPNAAAAVIYDQSANGDDLAAGIGAQTVSSTGATGTAAPGDTVVLSTTGGVCSVAPVITVTTAQPLAGIVSVPGICSAQPAAAQTQTATSGQLAASSWTVSYYNEGFTWPTTNAMGTARAFIDNSVTNALANLPNNSLFMSFPTLSWKPSTSTVFLVGSVKNANTGRTIVEAGGNSAWSLASNLYKTGTTPALTTTTNHRCGIAAAGEPEVMWWEQNGHALSCQSDNIAGSGSAATTPKFVGGVLGSARMLTPGAMDIDAMIICPSALSPTVATTAMASLASLYGIAPPTNAVFLATGDSLASANADTVDGTPGKFAAQALLQPVRYYNFAVSGTSIAVLAARATTDYLSVYNSSYSQFIVDVSAFPNDIRNACARNCVPSLVAASIESHYQTLVAELKGLGPNVQVIVNTQPLQCDIARNPNEWQTEQAVNQWLYSSYNVAPASGGLGADGLADLASDPDWGGWGPGPAYSGTGSALCGTPNAFSPDGLHLYSPIQQQEGAIEASAVNALLQ